MTVGIRIRNVNGFKQVDDRFRNLAVVAKGTTTVNSGNTEQVFGWPPVLIRINGDNPVIAFQCTTCYIRVRRNEVSPGVFDFYLYAWPVTVVPNWSGQLKYWIFDTPPAAPAGVGVRIRNRTTGLVVFDSRLEYMKVMGAVNRTAVLPQSDTSQYFAFSASSTNIAVLQVQSAMRIEQTVPQGQGQEAQLWSCMCRTNSNQVIVKDGSETIWSTFLPYPYAIRAHSFLILNVEGI